MRWCVVYSFWWHLISASAASARWAAYSNITSHITLQHSRTPKSETHHVETKKHQISSDFSLNLFFAWMHKESRRIFQKQKSSKEEIREVNSNPEASNFTKFKSYILKNSGEITYEWETRKIYSYLEQF